MDGMVRRDGMVRKDGMVTMMLRRGLLCVGFARRRAEREMVST